MAAPTTPDPSIPTPQPALSEGARLINTFIAPTKTFTDLRRKASWWGPWIVISIFSLVMMAAIGKQIGFDQVARNTVTHSSRAEQFDQLPPDQQTKQLNITSKFIAGAAYASPLLILFYCLLAAVTLWLTFKVAAGAETTFGQAYAIVMYAWLPGIIGAVLGTITMFAGVNAEGFDLNNPVGTNVGYYLDPETTNKFVKNLASGLDVLTIWTLILVGIGFSSTSKVKRSTAITIVVAWYLVYKVAGSALAAR